MARPKKPQVVDGVVLVENLYQDAEKRRGKFRYLRPNGTWKVLKGTLTPEEANAEAEHNNARRHLAAPATEPGADPVPGCWDALILRYIEEKEAEDPVLLTKESWRNMRYTLLQFGREFAEVAPHRITRPQIQRWWKGLTHHQQNKRHTELRRLFNWATGEGFCPQLEYNPFTLSDEKPRLYLKRKPEKERSPLTLPEFWQTYRRAGKAGLDGLQRAMAISLITTMRQGDICKLRFTQVVGGELRVIIGKSEAQRGAASATRLAWSLEEFPLLRDVVSQARADCLAARRCPFIVYHVPLRKRDYRAKATKEHPFQMRPDLLQKQFARVRPDVPNPPTFHEIRALSSVIYRQSGHDIDAIRELMAHTDEATTLAYQDRGDLPYKKVSLKLTAEDIGGSF